jgi:putative PEP-CTERM system TPR-repeat lipoprotein
MNLDFDLQLISRFNNKMRRELSKCHVFFVILVLFICWPAEANSSADDSYEKGLQSFQLGNIDEAYIHLKNALKDEPSNLPSRLLIGKVFFTKNQFHSAIQELEKLSESGVDPDLFLPYLVKSYFEVRRYTDVTNANIDVLLPSNRLDLLMLKGRAFLIMEQYTDALGIFTQGLELAPDNVATHEALARTYFIQGDIERTRTVLSEIEEIDPNSAQLYYIRSQIAQLNNNQKLAFEFLEKAFELNAEDPMIGRSLATNYIATNQFDKARVVIKGLLTSSPDEPFALLLDARLLLLSNQNDLAIAAFEYLVQSLSSLPPEALEAKPELLYVLGLSDYMGGNLERASRSIRRFINEGNTNINAVAVLTDIYIRQNQSIKAIKLLEQFADPAKQDLPLAIKWCLQYISNRKAFKCEFLLDELVEIHKDKVGLHYLRVKLLEDADKPKEALTYLRQYLKGTSYGETSYLAAELQFKLKEFKEALNIINELLQENATDVGLKLLKSDILRSLEYFAEAKEINQSILNEDPTNSIAQFNLATLLFDEGHVNAAQKAAQDLINSNAENSYKVWMLLAESLYAQDKYDEALDAALKAKNVGLKLRTTGSSELLVKIYRSQKNFDKAISEINYLKKKHSLNPNYLLIHANLLVEKNDLKAAALEYNKLRALWTESPLGLLKLGQAQRKAKLFDDSEKTLLAAKMLSPSILYIHIELMRLYLESDRPELAKELNIPLLKSNNNNSNIRLLAGDIAIRDNDFLVAHSHYLRALELNPQYLQAVKRLYQLAVVQGIDPEQFEQRLTAIVNEFPEAEIHRNILADYLNFAGKFELAIEQYRWLINRKEYPNLKFVLNNMANLLVKKAPETALQLIERALKIDNELAAFHDTKGWVLVSLGELGKGLATLRKAQTLDSKAPSTLYHIGYTLEKLGRRQEALISLRSALATNKQFSEKSLTEQLINEIK